MDLFFSIWVITIIDKENMYGKDMVQQSTECWLEGGRRNEESGWDKQTKRLENSGIHHQKIKVCYFD